MLRKIFIIIFLSFVLFSCSEKNFEQKVFSKISWKSCENEEFKNWFSEQDNPSMFDCANLEVPLDYEDKNSKKITLALTRFEASAKNPIWDLVMVTGWPWMHSLSFATSFYDKSFLKLTANFNIIWFAPRWVFPSYPQIDCSVIWEENSEEIMKKCLENSEKNFLKNISTKEAVEDLEQIRQALWWEKFSVLSYSYWTKVLANYVEKYWKNLRAGIFDWVVDLNEDMFTMLKNQELWFQKSFDNFVKYCLEQENCIFEKEKWDFNLQFQNFLKNIDQKDLKYSTWEKVFWDHVLAVFQDKLMWKTFWDDSISMIFSLKNWETEVFENFYSNYLFNSTTNKDDNAPTDMWFQVINCADHSPKISERSKEKYLQKQKEIDDISKYDNFFEKDENYYLDLCYFWPFDWKDIVRIPKKQIWTPNLLFIAQTFDPTTPYQNAVNMAKAFDSTLLTKTWDWHSVSFSMESNCIDKKALEYLFYPEKKLQNFTCE